MLKVNIVLLVHFVGCYNLLMLKIQAFTLLIILIAGCFSRSVKRWEGVDKEEVMNTLLEQYIREHFFNNTEKPGDNVNERAPSQYDYLWPDENQMQKRPQKDSRVEIKPLLNSTNDLDDYANNYFRPMAYGPTLRPLPSAPTVPRIENITLNVSHVNFGQLIDGGLATNGNEMVNIGNNFYNDIYDTILRLVQGVFPTPPPQGPPKPAAEAIQQVE